MRKRIVLLFMLFLVILLDPLKAGEVLDWQDCIREAARNNPDLISAQAGVSQSQASQREAASGLLPQITSSVEGSRSQVTAADAAGVSARKTQDSYSYGVSGSQLIFDGFKKYDDLKAAGENIKAARENFRFTSSSVRLRLRTAFIELLKAQELVKITMDIYEIRRSNLELITLRYESGMEHRGALLNAQANLAQAQYDINRNRRALEVAQRKLVKEMGRKVFVPLEVRGDFKVSDQAAQKPDFEKLASTNSSLLKAIADKNAALFGIKSAQANFFPSISAQAGAGKSGSDWPPKHEEWNAGVVASLPLFEGGLRLAQVSRARALYTQTQANERSARDSIIVTLEQSWAALQDAVASVEIEKKFLEATQERSRIAEAQYSLGLIQFDNWTIIEDDLVAAKRAYLDAQANALLAEASWIQAKGETLEYAQK